MIRQDKERRHRVKLTVDNTVYQGWTGVTVIRSIEQAAAGFEINVADKWQYGHLRWPIKPGAECELSLDDETVIQGHVDESNPSFDAGSHSLHITGRCQVGDLVDCSAIASPDEWHGLRLEDVAQRLCEPFGITVSAQCDTGDTFEPFKLQQGETVHEAIERMCRARACLAVSDGRGGLLILRAGEGRAASDIKEGDNLLTASATYSWRDRYSEYLVKGQQPGVKVDAEEARSPKGSAKDEHVDRYRPLLVLADAAATGQTPLERARWEATVRAGKGVRISAKVQGWRMTGGDLWPLNALTRITSPLLDLDEILLISALRFNLSEQGSTSELTLCHPDAFKELPQVEKGGKGKTASPSGLKGKDNDTKSQDLTLEQLKAMDL